MMAMITILFPPHFCDDLTPLTQVRIAEFFGVSEAMIAARGCRRSWLVEQEEEEEDALEIMKKRAEESFEE
jgi:hypothetical protein